MKSEEAIRGRLRSYQIDLDLEGYPESGYYRQKVRERIKELKWVLNGSEPKP